MQAFVKKYCFASALQAASLAAPSGGSGRIETAEERAERKRLEKLIKLESRKVHPPAWLPEGII